MLKYDRHIAATLFFHRLALRVRLRALHLKSARLLSIIWEKSPKSMPPLIGKVNILGCSKILRRCVHMTTVDGR